jgi:ribosomal protein L11
VPSNAIATVVSLPGQVPMTAKVSKVLPATGVLSLGVPVIVKVTVKASKSFETQTKVTGTYLWLSSTAYGKSNVTTQVGYTLIGL